MSWRVVAALAILGALAWLGYQIARAGSDVVVQRIAAPDTMKHGRVQGKRIDGRSWSMDYDSVTMSPDMTTASIQHVRDGRIHRVGKPDVLMQADGVTVNTATNDISVTGPVTFTTEEGPGRKRTLKTVGARYIGATKELDLEHSTTITEGDAAVTVAKVTINFRTGEMSLGRIEAEKPGSSS